MWWKRNFQHIQLVILGESCTWSGISDEQPLSQTASKYHQSVFKFSKLKNRTTVYLNISNHAAIFYPARIFHDVFQSVIISVRTHFVCLQSTISFNVLMSFVTCYCFNLSMAFNSFSAVFFLWKWLLILSVIFISSFILIYLLDNFC